MSPSLGLLDLQPHNRAHWGALRTGIAVGIPLLVLNSLGHLDWSLFAVFGAFTAIYGRGASYGTRLRMQVSAAVCLVVAVVLGTTVGAIQAGSFLAVAACAIVSPLAFVASRRFGWLPPSALFIVFAVGATSSIPQPFSVVPVALAIAAAAAVLSIGLGQAGRLFPAGRTHAKAAASAGSSLRSVLGSPDAPPELVRHAAGPLVAGTVTSLLGIGHPYWAMVAAVTPLGAADTGGILKRALQRLLGTGAGLLVSLGLLSLALPPLAVIAVVIILQVWTELFIARNYGLAVVSITPLALLMSSLAVPVNPLALVLDRGVETVLGLGVAVVVVLATHHWVRARAT